MAQYRPHLLSYRLRRLFDSGHCTASEFAWQMGESKEFIEGIIRGRKVNRETELNIGKLLASYVRRYPELRPEPPAIRLVEDSAEPAIEHDGTPRGVFEEIEYFDGMRAFKVIDDLGRCRARIEVCASDIRTQSQEYRLKERLERYLDNINPVGDSVAADT